MRRSRTTGPLTCLLAVGLGLAAVSGAKADPWIAACQAVRQATGAPTPQPGDLMVLPGALDEHFTRAEAMGFSGSAFVEDRGQLVLSNGYGFADWTTGRPVSPSVIFDIGSVAKQFTAAAILKLEEMGALRVEDEIGRFFPQAPAETRAITIHQLLTHTAGFREEESAAGYAADYDEALAIMLGSPLLSRPGEAYRYSNLGYALLGAIIQIASGQDYETFLRRNLWEPAGLVETGWTVADPRRYAEGSAFRPATVRPGSRMAEGPPYSRRGPGSLYSSTEDLRRWVHALRSGRVLSPESMAKLVTPHFPEQPGGRTYAAYGWAVSASQSGVCSIWHDGSNTLVFNVLRIYPERDLVTHEMMLNFAGPLRNPVLSVTPAILFGRQTSPLPEIVPADADQTTALAGLWRDETGETVELRTAGGRLYAPTASSNVIRLFTGFEVLTPEDAQRVQPLLSRLPGLMDALQRGDYAPLFEVLRAGENQEEEIRYWPTQWADWGQGAGAYLGSELIGTVRDEDDLSTYLLLRFERSSAIANVFHHEGGRITVGNRITYGDAEDFVPSQYVFTPTGPGRWRVHNPAFPAGVEASLQPDGALSLSAPGGRRVLRRVAE